MQLGLEIEKPRFRKGLGEDICRLILGRYISEAQMFQLNLFSHEVVVNFHVLRSGMEDRIGSKVSCANIVTPENGCTLEWNT